MYKTISKKVVSLLINNEVVKSDEQKVYEYSFEILLSTFVSILTILSLSILVNKIFISVLFMFSFMITRLFCGGYHAKHHLTCLLTTIVNYLIFLLFTFLLTQQNIKIAVIILSVISLLLIFLFAPVEHEYNPLSESEKKRHRMRSRALILIYSFLSIISLLKNVFIIEIFSIGFGVFSVAFSLLLAKLEKATQKYDE